MKTTLQAENQEQQVEQQIVVVSLELQPQLPAQPTHLGVLAQILTLTTHQGACLDPPITQAQAYSEITTITIRYTTFNSLQGSRISCFAHILP